MKSWKIRTIRNSIIDNVVQIEISIRKCAISMYYLFYFRSKRIVHLSRLEINFPLSASNYRSPSDDLVNGLNPGIENESWASAYNCFQSCLNRSEFTRSQVDWKIHSVVETKLPRNFARRDSAIDFPCKFRVPERNSFVNLRKFDRKVRQIEAISTKSYELFVSNACYE